MNYLNEAGKWLGLPEEESINEEEIEKVSSSLGIKKDFLVSILDDDEKPRIDTIGSKSWSQRKEKVQKKVEEIAEKLIDLYSKRKASKGFPFPKDGEWAAAFENVIV